ncbi:MAG: hypothetical protein H7255_12150 [Ramlibacter sp.]|nr:hypothetical protein [Ramlibacter sp.]
MADDDIDRTASLMTPDKLARVKPQAAVSPAAWLNQMAADAAHQHVRRIGELRKDLKTQGQSRDYSQITSEIARLAKAAPKLDFSLLQGHGMWSRMTGKSKTAAAEFAEQFIKLKGAGDDLMNEVKALEQQLQESAAATDLSLLELEVEYKAIEKVQDQGARWLQDMRSQLKERQASPGDAAAARQIKDDEARCEILVTRLKQLRDVSAAAQAAHQHALAAATPRKALAQSLRQALGARLADWRVKLQAVVDATEAGDAASIDAAMESHRELQLALKDASADCSQMRLHENTLAESLHTLKRQAETARVQPAA